MSRPVFSQLEALVEFLERNPEIAKGHLHTSQAKFTTKKKWDEVAVVLNAIGGALKDGKGWAKYWADRKYGLKKHISQQNASVNGTGGGPSTIASLSDIEERMVALLGGRGFAEGDQQFRVPVNIDSQESVPFAFVEVCEEVSQEVILPSTTRRSPRIRALRSQPSQLRDERERLTNIENKRVEAELLQAQTSRETAGHLDRIVIALDNLAAAVMVQSDSIATAGRTIAAALTLQAEAMRRE